MKNLIKNTIISQAMSLGFDFEDLPTDTDLNELNDILLDFFNENTDKLERLEAECEVHNNTRGQYVVYGNYHCSGEIVYFSIHWHKAPDTKVFHSDFIIEDKDGLIKNMNLYYLVGKTDYNS